MRPRARSVTVCLLLSMVAGVAVLPSARAGDGDAFAYEDVAEGHWADEAVAYTAEQRDWLRFGGTKFRPGRLLTRWQLARAAVRAFAPEAPVDPDLTFTDLDGHRATYANIATSLRWFPVRAAFKPDGAVSKRLLNRVLVRALGLEDAVRDLSTISTEDGYRFQTPPAFAYLAIGNELALNPNFSSPDDDRDLYPWEKVSRGYAAVALMQADNAGWRVWSAQKFVGVTLPAMSNKRKEIVEFAFKYIGYPYIYAGEWHRRSSANSCCGFQPKGGFDCSGFQWWVLKAPGDGFDNTMVRPYRGGEMHQRRASLIAKEATFHYRLKYNELLPGDAVFFATGFDPGNWQDIDHGGVALGNGWFIHSSGSRAGVTISPMGDGDWWRDAFVMGRRVIGRPPA